MKEMQKTKIRWGEGRILAAALALVLVICLLNAMNRLPRKITAEPVHSVRNDLYEAAKTDINRADRDALLRLPHIGETLADRIIAARPFSSTEDLLRVDGIGEGILEEIRPLVKVS